MYGQWMTSDLKKKVPVLWFLCSWAKVFVFYYTVGFFIDYTFGFSQV